MIAINYEDELEAVLMDALKKKFGVLDENKLFSYIAYRYYLVKHRKVDRHIMDFILYELNSVCCVYKDVTFENNISAPINNLTNIYDDWKSYFVLDDTICKKYTDYAKGKAKKWKDTEFFESYYLYYALEILNKDFKTQNVYVDINEFKQRDKNKWSSLEDEINRILNMEDNTTAFISENDLEDYLICHLDLIEDGLKFVSRQYILPEGRMDILARDKQNNMVVIELKIDDDKRIVWQSIYYRIEMQKRFPNQNIRIMTVMKNYPSYLIEPLLTVNVELFEYNLIVQNQQIKDLQLRKVEYN